MNINDNIHADENNKIKIIIKNIKESAIKTGSPTTNVDSVATQTLNKDSKPNEKLIVPSAPNLIIQNNVSSISHLVPGADVNRGTQVMNYNDISFTKNFNSFLLQKIIDKNFISDVARNFVEAILTNKVTQNLFKDSIENNFLKLPKIENKDKEKES
jgi:hypothetical protein